MTVRSKRRPGRPTTGPHGVAVSKYKKMTVYVDPKTEALLAGVHALNGKPAWKILGEGLESYVKTLPPKDRLVVDAVVSRRMAAEKTEE